MKKVNVFKTFFMMVPILMSAAPVLFVLRIIAFTAQGVSYALITPVTQNFFEKAINFTAGNVKLEVVFIGLAILALTHIVKQVINGSSNLLSLMSYGKIEGLVSLGLHKKMSKIAPVYFEDTQILDEMNKAIKGKDEATWFAGHIIMILCTSSYYLCMAVYLIQIKPILVVLLILVFVPTSLTYILRTKIFSKAEDKAAPIRREFDYYENCMVGREYFKETRILGAFSYFKKLYIGALATLNKLRFQASVKSDLAELGMQILSLSGYVGILLLLTDLLMKGEISIGAFAAVFASVDQMFSWMSGFFNGISDLAGSYGLAQNYIRFMQMPERNGVDIETPTNVDITLHNVSFSYPSVEHKAVNDVSLKICHNETIAIVGENGSGKTTLIRLITGLYLPDEGDILYGEVNTKTVSSRSLYKNISAVFQKYQRYQMTLRENIGISEINNIATDIALDNISTQAGIDKNDSSFTNGYDTMLSKEFDGVDLSGGQWQRLAIARGLFRSHTFIVLDEPTAAIDPIEETKIYNHFADISKDKTAIIVTHRLGSVKLADRVLVMKQGRLVEQGTHAELIAADGEYTRLYRSQKQWYS